MSLVLPVIICAEKVSKNRSFDTLPPRMQSVRTKEEREVLEHFAGVVSYLFNGANLV